MHDSIVNKNSFGKKVRLLGKHLNYRQMFLFQFFSTFFLSLKKGRKEDRRTHTHRSTLYSLIKKGFSFAFEAQWWIIYSHGIKLIRKYLKHRDTRSSFFWNLNIVLQATFQKQKKHTYRIGIFPDYVGFIKNVRNK